MTQAPKLYGVSAPGRDTAAFTTAEGATDYYVGEITALGYDCADAETQRPYWADALSRGHLNYVAACGVKLAPLTPDRVDALPIPPYYKRTGRYVCTFCGSPAVYDVHVDAEWTGDVACGAHGSAIKLARIDAETAERHARTVSALREDLRISRAETETQRSLVADGIRVAEEWEALWGAETLRSAELAALCRRHERILRAVVSNALDLARTASESVSITGALPGTFDYETGSLD